MSQGSQLSMPSKWAPSANRSGHVSPTTARHRWRQPTCLRHVRQKLGVDSHHVFEVTVNWTILDHPDFTIALDNLGLDLANLLDVLQAVDGIEALRLAEAFRQFETEPGECPGRCALHRLDHGPDAAHDLLAATR